MLTFWKCGLFLKIWVICTNPCRGPFFTLACEHGIMQYKGARSLRAGKTKEKEAAAALQPAVAHNEQAAGPLAAGKTKEKEAAAWQQQLYSQQ